MSHTHKEMLKEFEDDYKLEPSWKIHNDTRNVASEVPYDKASDTMIGGTHYKMLPIEPWEIIERNNMGFFEGNALKYIMRFKLKNGVEDLKKARHYLDKLIEMSV
jgi:hypothetical protein